ncbi:NAD-dependent epimerase/dehydratase family protein [Nocardia sp. A7]|uniref:NAD-dependent epimerase/dehydratase family protein n=1 Tax=Nocardia sp. A7 TaxID=2789274 RepID=UPI003977FF66
MSVERQDPAPRVAVLGGTGSVGRHVCAEFAGAGYEVIVIARKPTAAVERYRFVPLDIAGENVGRITEILTAEQVGVVVNAAGSWSNSLDELTRAHIQLLANLVTALAAVTPAPRLVHIGTVHEYGVKAAGTVLDETAEPTPETDFARTKFAGSTLALDAAAAGAVDAVVLRVSNVYGPDPAAASFLGFLAAKLPTVDPAVGIELTIADARRDYVDNRDVARAVLAAARHTGPGRVFNIGSGVATPLRELVYGLAAAAGLPATAVREQTAEITSKGGDWTCVDATLAHTELGWRPRYTPAESVRALLDEPFTAST